MIEKLSWRQDILLPRKIVFESSDFSSAPKKATNEEFVHWKTRHGVYNGLKNVGNTCFLNSTLQCLIYTPPVQNYQHTCSKAFCVFCALKRLYNNKSSVPEEFLNTLPRISRQFQIGRQADAHELLRFLIDKIDSKELKQNIFGGVLQSTVKCKECRHESISLENFLDLSLEVSGNYIEKCLSDFFREEVLTGNNKYNCPQCKHKSTATKQYLIKSPPNILTIQLKRFTNQGKKDSRTVKFSESLKLDSYLIYAEPVTYTLYAVLIHIGFGCRSGHYYSFIKAPNDVWFEANDSCVSQASVQRVLNNNGAYILMYKKDSPRPKFNDNNYSDNRNSFENAVEVPAKSPVHPSSVEQPYKKLKVQEIPQQNFKKYWSNGNLTLGYLKDEYDKKLDMGKKPKKKNKKRHISANVWDRIKINSY
jgi:ubiquitin C-terminal hydrolase